MRVLVRFDKLLKLLTGLLTETIVIKGQVVVVITEISQGGCGFGRRMALMKMGSQIQFKMRGVVNTNTCDNVNAAVIWTL